MKEPVYLWLCHLDDLDGAVGYVGPSGETRNGGVPFVATPTEAHAEGERRSHLWEERTGGWVSKVTLDRRGLAREGPGRANRSPKRRRDTPDTPPPIRR